MTSHSYITGRSIGTGFVYHSLRVVFVKSPVGLHTEIQQQPIASMTLWNVVHHPEKRRGRSKTADVSTHWANASVAVYIRE